MQHLLCKPTRLRLMKSVWPACDDVRNERLALRILVSGQATRITRGAQIPGAKPPWQLNFVVTPSMNRSSAWHLKNFTLLASKSLRFCLDLWIICAPQRIPANNEWGFPTREQYQTWQRWIYRWGYVCYILQLTKIGAWTLRSSNQPLTF